MHEKSRKMETPSPGWPSPVLRVGVSGHRPNRLPKGALDELASQIRLVLRTIRAAARTMELKHPVTLRLLSSLAEGSDRIVARLSEEPEFAFELEVPLPMPPEEYEKDFETEASRVEFRALLAGAKSVYTLPAPTGERSLGYLAAGEIVLAQCDLLIGIWDGKASAGTGGTADILDRAKAAGIPIAIVSADAPHTISFSRAGDPWPPAKDPNEPLAAMHKQVHSLLHAPAGLAETIKQYREEVWPRRHPVSAYVTLRLFGDHKLKLPPRPDYDRKVDEIETPSLQSYFLWADTLAVYYGEQSRSASLRLQLLATLAVASALLNIPLSVHPVATRLLSIVEVCSTLSLLLGVHLSQRGQWHSRWLRYRAMAEQLRCVDLLKPLCLSFRPTQSTNDFEERGREALFVPWFLGQIEREQPLQTVVIDQHSLAHRRDRLRAVLESQIGFHRTSARRYRAAEEAFRSCGLALFGVAFLLGLYDVAHAFDLFPAAFVHFLSQYGALKPALDTAAALLPALGAAAAAIVAQGEYKRLSERSAGMQHTLETLERELPAQRIPTYGNLCTLSVQLSQVLSSEVHDWSMLVAAKPPTLPV